MNKPAQNNLKRSFIGISVALILAVLITYAGSQYGLKVGELSIFTLCVIIAFVINWLMFIPQYLAQSERYYDLTGSITYISVTIIAVLFAGRFDLRSVIITIMVIVWAIRLGSFLFMRIRKVGKDGRFDDIKPDAPRYFMTWTLQALWVTVTLGPALATITAFHSKPIDAWLVIGGIMWLIGFVIEVVADQQKTKHRSNPDNKDRFIKSGLWAWSRHPNYFGEILLWLGMAVITVPVLQGAQLFTLISPLFVYLLITKVSGISMLEHRADAKWGNDSEYLAYKRETPELIPRPPK